MAFITRKFKILEIFLHLHQS